LQVILATVEVRHDSREVRQQATVAMLQGSAVGLRAPLRQGRHDEAKGWPQP
jgi:hypothetical protein